MLFFACTNLTNLSTIGVYNVGEKVSKTVEPPILMSRVLAFVLATSVVTLGALVATLIKMIPLERPEVFFLYTPTRATNMVITPMTPDVANKKTIEAYQEGFIREYITARNSLEIGTKSKITRTNWSKIVQPWSSKKVFEDFEKTALYKQYVFNEQPPAYTCSVHFSPTQAIVYMGKGLYEVNFTWLCKNENSGGHPDTKNYKIQIRIQSELDEKVSDVFNNIEKLRDNPLGIQVVEYKIKNNGFIDPLDSDLSD